MYVVGHNIHRRKAKPCDQDSYPRKVLVLSVFLASFISFILDLVVLVPLLFILGVGLSPYILLFTVIDLIIFMMV